MCVSLQNKTVSPKSKIKPKKPFIDIPTTYLQLTPKMFPQKYVRKTYRVCVHTPTMDRTKF